MKLFNRLLLVLLVLLIAVLTYAMTAPWPQESRQEAEKPVEKTGAGYAKPHAGIELRYPAPTVMQVGDSQSLDLDFRLHTLADSLVVSVETEAGLQLDSATRFEFISVREAAIIMQFSALEEGRFHITVNAVMNSDGQSQARSFAIPVTVGEPATDQSSSKSSTPQGHKSYPEQGVISMPAQETTN